MSEAALERPAPGPAAGGAEEGGELSFSEELLWFTEHGGVAPFPFLECPTHLSLVLRLEGPLETRALDRAVQEIARRHSVLRARFPPRDGRPVRLVDASAPPIRCTDLSARPGAERDAALAGALEEEVGPPFDLASGPLFRTRLLKLDEELHVFAFTVHHLVFDSHSRGVLARELAVLYGAYARGAEPELPELAAQYDDYVRWQRDRLAGGAIERLTEAWRNRIGAPAELRFPASAGPGAGGSVSRAFALDAGEVESIRQVSRANAVTPAITLLALFALLLRREAGATELVVGLPLSNRRRREFEELIGLFIDVMVVRASLEGNPPFPVLLGRVRDGLRQAVAQQDLPYWHFVRAEAAATGRPPAAPYRVVFNFMNRGAGRAPELHGLRAESVPAGNRPPALAELSLMVRDQGSVWQGELSFRRASFPEDAADRWTAVFRALVSEVLGAPGRALDESMRQDGP